MSTHQSYYVPAQSAWPIVGAIGLFLIAFGAGHFIAQLDTDSSWGFYTLLAGVATILYMVFGWFRTVISESMSGLYSDQMDRSFRQGMSWFIFSEVMFFGAFFGALFFIRIFSVPWLGGASNNAMTHEVLWPTFEAVWPLITTPDGTKTEAMAWTGLPLANTLILLVSSVTLHFAHTSLEKSKRTALKIWLGLTIVLGIVFLFLQVEEYTHAYTEMGLTLQSGVYGNTFFMLTGFHGMHVTLGTVFLIVLFFRVLKGHFTPENHFGFQAGSWYWHFVDVVWLCLFVFVYIL
ncbi:cytochrome c oxidase subunit 3 [Parashewanella spongiae]|uniref:cytochrome-c oxidase n=1 Tax=Parashewanella spongiae TaxID=342950 RepID=A0A3A6TNW8_9GAMM|nr:cytochrome c oxidase subunit 3 [Parashewanella spongiae]MCL1077869.1 cytochrome c oxidase subunit 3 [Parashewanella spongiae]RJY17612.1 cytochrome c oxidase subunit 3 [Parashewanella spongiae]